MSYHNPPTDKQLRYIEALAREAGVGGDAWDQFDVSRSKAQRKATSADASAVIDALQERVRLRQEREGLPEGSIHASEILLGGDWRAIGDSTLELYRQHQERLQGRTVDLWAERNRRKAAGEDAPLAAAIRTMVDAPAPDPRAGLIEAARVALAALTPEERVALAAEERQ